MTSFVLLLTAIGTPWAVITMIGSVRCGGVYDADALQVFNRRARGGIYWYRSGWNVPATAAWAVGAGVGVLAVSLPSYEGPLLSLTGGVDCSRSSCCRGWWAGWCTCWCHSPGPTLQKSPGSTASLSPSGV
ncbi:cytosine permease [Streptomyces violaceorubidus]